MPIIKIAIIGIFATMLANCTPPRTLWWKECQVEFETCLDLSESWCIDSSGPLPTQHALAPEELDCLLRDYMSCRGQRAYCQVHSHPGEEL